MDISVVVPVFNNEGSLEELSSSLLKLAFKAKKSLEIIFVNDGSKDKSLLKIKELSKKEENISFISFSRNFGQIPAIIAGMKIAKGHTSVVMSADLQDPISLIFEFHNQIILGNQVVIGHRVDREDDFISVITSKFFYALMHNFNPNMPKGGFDFFALGIKAKEAYNQLDERNRFLQGDVLYLGFNPIYIPYKRKKRKHGKSGWTFKKKLKYFIDGLLNTSYAPIRIMSLLGLTFSFLGVVYSCIIVYLRFAENVPFKGWAPIMILLLLIGGLIMFMLGIIGEYIWRIFDETRKRPYYFISETSNENKSEA